MGKELPQGYRLGDYSIERLLTRSGLQTVYAGQQVSSSRACRITVFNVDPDGEPWQRFKSDLEQVKALSHPFVAECLDVATSENGLAYAAFAQPAGEDLAARLRRGGALTLRESLVLSRQVAAALHAAHRIDVLHRDLTPENIYLVKSEAGASEPEYERVLLYGFGASRLFESAFEGAGLFGHPEYMAPEQITGLSFDIGPAADQYALALVVYQVLSASQPFRAESPGSALLKVVRTSPEHLRALRPDLPTHVDAAVNRGLAKERTARFPDLPAFIAALEAGERLPPALIAATQPWLGGSASTDEALNRAMAAGSVTPSLGVVAQGLSQGADQSSPIPEIVEDSATVPNTMEAVMKLALPPEKSSPGLSVKNAVQREPSGPLEIELEAIDPTPPPLDVPKILGPDGPSSPGGRSGPSRPARAAAGNNLAMRSGEANPVGTKTDALASKTDQDGSSVIVTATVDRPRPQSGLMRGVERGIFLGIGLLLGYFLHALMR